MDGTQTSPTDTSGAQTDTPTEDDKKDNPKPDDIKKTDSQLLKEENDDLEFELKRKQTIRNEALLAGTSGGNVKVEEKEETPKEYRDRIDMEIAAGQHND